MSSKALHVRHNLAHRRDKYRQFLGIALIALLCATGSPTGPVSFSVAAGLIAVGLLVRLWASGHIKKDQDLAQDGPYALVRHPLYVGNLTLLLGYCLASGLWWAYPLAVAVVWGFYPPAIAREDGKLERLFGERWRHWAASTHALIPRFDRLPQAFGGDWSFTQSLRANGEPIIAAALLWGLWVLFQRLG